MEEEEEEEAPVVAPKSKASDSPSPSPTPTFSRTTPVEKAASVAPVEEAAGALPTPMGSDDDELAAEHSRDASSLHAVVSHSPAARPLGGAAVVPTSDAPSLGVDNTFLACVIITALIILLIVGPTTLYRVTASAVVERINWLRFKGRVPGPAYDPVTSSGEDVEVGAVEKPQRPRAKPLKLGGGGSPGQSGAGHAVKHASEATSSGWGVDDLDLEEDGEGAASLRLSSGSSEGLALRPSKARAVKASAEKEGAGPDGWHDF